MAKNNKRKKKQERKSFYGDKGSPEAAREHLSRCKTTLLSLCDILGRRSLDLENYRAFTEFFVQSNYSVIREVLIQDVVLCKLITGRSFIDDDSDEGYEETMQKIVTSVLMAEVARSVEEYFDGKDEELCQFKNFLNNLSIDSLSFDPEDQ